MMSKQREKVIGIDIASEKLDIVILSKAGKILLQKEIENNRSGHKKIQGLSKKHNSLVIMEATGPYHAQLAFRLHQAGCEVSVVNPLIIKRYTQMQLLRAKTDKLDAKTIAQYALDHEPPVYQPACCEEEKIRIKADLIDKLKDQVRQNKNRIGSLKRNPYDMSDEIKDLESINEEIEKKIKKNEKELRNYIISTYPEEHQKVSQIKGVGIVLESLIFGQFKGFRTFENAKQVVAYAGINPSPFQSGKSIKKKGSISKKGRNRLRGVLYMCALSAKKYNPKCQELYNRLIQSGKKKTEALIAVAAKLLRQCFAVVKYKRDYQPNYYLIQQMEFEKKLSTFLKNA